MSKHRVVSRLIVAIGLISLLLIGLTVPAFASSSGTSGTQLAGHHDTTACDGDPSGKSGSGSGANSTPTGPYTNTCPNSDSGNGNGGGTAVGKPCAGCVGQADDKNPPGQYPDSSDHNAGYECDTNHGIARTNPAHTGCPTPPPPSSGSGTAAIGTPLCDESTVSVTLTNNNDSTDRVFTIKLGSTTVDTETLAAGTTRTVQISFPQTGTSTLTVVSGGIVLASKTLKFTHCPTPLQGGKVTISDLACEEDLATITLSNTGNVAGGDRVFSILLDGNLIQTVTVAAGQTTTTTVTIPDNGAAHTVRVNWLTKSESKTLTVTHNCSSGLKGGKVTISDLACEEDLATISLSNTGDVAGGDRVFSILLDGNLIQTVTVAAGQTTNTTATIPDNGAAHTVRVNWLTKSESKTLTVTHDCGNPLGRKGGAAVIPLIPCGATSSNVSFTNTGNTAGGPVTFTITRDSLVLATVVEQAGDTGHLVVTLPVDGSSHLVAVHWLATTVSNTLQATGGPCIETSVLGEKIIKPPTSVLGLEITRPTARVAASALGAPMPRTGTGTSMLALLAALMVLIGGLVLAADSRLTARASLISSLGLLPSGPVAALFHPHRWRLLERRNLDRTQGWTYHASTNRD